MVDSPYYRDQPPAALAGLVMNAFGPSNRQIQLGGNMASFPISTPINAEGTPFAAYPLSLTIQTGKLTATLAAADAAKRAQATSPTSGFVDGATSNVPQGDWRPYLASEPGTIKESAHGSADTGGVAWDHTGGHVYWIQDIYNSIPDSWSLFLFKDGVQTGAAIDVGGGGNGPHDGAYLDYDPVNDQIWVSWQLVLTGNQGVKIRSSAGAVVSTVTTSYFAQVRCCRSLNAMLLAEWQGTNLHVFDLTTQTQKALATLPGPSPLLWTARAWGSWLAVVYTDRTGTLLAIFNATTFALIDTYRLSSLRSIFGRAYLTVLTLPILGDVGVGFAGGEWFVLSRRFDGVIPYGDFSGLSCAGALKEIATVTLATLNVDRFNNANLVQRPFLEAQLAAATVQDPLTRTSRVIWEFFRTSVEVSGTFADGTAFDEILGDSGDSAKRLSVSSPLMASAGLARAVGTAYSAYLSQLRSQEDLGIEELEDLVRVGDKVGFGDQSWLATQVQTNPRDRIQTLRLFEVP
jgi:hypothetical protein